MATCEVVEFDMLDVAIFSSPAPSSVTATTGQVIPGGFDNSASGNQYTLSTLQFDIDGDIDFEAPDPTNFFDFQVRTATASGGQIVFDRFTHFQEPPAEPLQTYIVLNSETDSYINTPFRAGDLIGDGTDEFIRTTEWNIAIDEGGTVHNYQEGDNNYVGFVLDSGSFGWIRASYDPAGGGGVGTLTFLDGAYEDTGAPIVAGGGVFVPVEGDYNGDNLVDAADYAVWRNNLGLMGGATVDQGDGTGDGNVTTADYDYWRSRYGNTDNPAMVAETSTAPEPSALLLATAFLGAFLRRRS